MIQPRKLSNLEHDNTITLTWDPTDWELCRMTELTSTVCIITLNPRQIEAIEELQARLVEILEVFMDSKFLFTTLSPMKSPQRH